MNVREKRKDNIFSPLGSGLSMFCFAFLLGKSVQATVNREVEDMDILIYAIFYGSLEYTLSKLSFNQSCFFSFASPYLRQGLNYLTDAVDEDFCNVEERNLKN